MTSRPLAICWLLLAAVSCKDRGQRLVELDIPASCEQATDVQVLLIRGVTCGDCRCGACVAPCRADNCTLACDGACPIEELDQGLSVRPPEAGVFAVVYELGVTDPDTGIRRVVATACADVEVDADGTSNSTQETVGHCCPDGPDAGAGGSSP